ncbi:hypothetical protein [Peptoniphilus harei]|uniref:hypothetical protein n=1 Tax=Peptoniphilus harei TaxID=54005 RepID=UPI00290F314A|nr:hypothetical protein [Peptoniphilus harei]MDU5417284.1 hypothetical protein [Peptoniphilus harei]
MWQYRQAFKTLVDLTNTKLSTIAFTLGYDISYISKWNSGRKLPSSKNIYTINRKLSSLFAKVIVEEDKIDDFFLAFNLNNKEILTKESKKALEVLIYKLLNEAYMNSNQDLPMDKVSNTNLIFKNSSIDKELKEILEKTLGKKKKVDIWATFDINSHFAQILLQVGKNLDKDVEFNLHLLCKKEDLEDFDILKNITDNSRINIELYEDPGLDYNFILVRDTAYFILREEAAFSFLTYGEELDTLFEITSFVMGLFKGLNKIIVFSQPEELAKSSYRKYFYSDSDFLFLSNYGFEFLLPNQIIDRIIQKIDDEKDFKKAEAENIKLLWEELFSDAEINFLTTRTGLLKYFETGEIYYCSIRARLSIEEIEAHLNNIISVMKKNKNINFYIIKDNRTLQAMGLDKFNFFISENNMFFKKIDDDGRLTSTSLVTDSKIHHKIHDRLEEIMESSYSQKYEVDDLEKLFHKYAQVFKKMSHKA